MKQVVQYPLSLLDCRLVRLSGYNRRLQDTDLRLAEMQQRLTATQQRLAEAEAKLADSARREQRAREVTQLQPLALPLVDGAFFIQVKIDYPDIFRPNPPHYTYRHVLEVLKRHQAAILRNAEALRPAMYGPVMNNLPTAMPNPVDPYWNNGMFERDDARAVYALTGHVKPKRIIEVGSGQSTKFFRKAITDFNLDCELLCIDPVPRAEIRSVADKILYQHIKDVDLALFDTLDDHDILFWDGSHIVYNGTDTTHFYLNVLPGIKKKVLVHVHDIQLPHEYEAGYSAHYYNEQYMLATLLLNSIEWAPVFPVFWLKRLGQLQHGGVSFWMSRQALLPGLEQPSTLLLEGPARPSED
ncbi:MAG: class I SAM-dependent methyltransferase [Planctomycetes bacterium]|nr:class I SAM-dependent methyltransferase [Planctomycetota bacterium]